MVRKTFRKKMLKDLKIEERIEELIQITKLQLISMIPTYSQLWNVTTGCFVQHAWFISGTLGVLTK